jgi:phosphoglycerol transferase
VGKASPSRPGRDLRADFLRATLLALLTALLWCTVEDRWTPAAWQTPLTYLDEPEKSDVLLMLAWVRAARDGHLSPYTFTNVPELGAPYVANWDDFPLPEKPLICLTGLLARAIGLFPAANFALLLAHVLAAVAFYAACRLLGAAWLWSAAGALVFAFSRYLFAHGLHHLTVAYAWHVPLCLVVCEWLFRAPGLRFGERRFLFALAVVTGIQHVYYTNLFVQFVLLAGLLRAWRGGWREILPALAITGTAAAGFVLMNLNTIFYQLLNGANPQALTRNYQWLEIYGLKIVDLVIPPPDHPFPPFAAWGAGYVKEVLLSPGELPPTAYLGLLGLAALGWLTLVSLRRAAEHRPLPLEAWLILWILLYASVGGLNGIIGTLGWQLFRSTTRYSFFILCLVLMAAVRRLSLWRSPHQVPPYLAGTAAVLLAVWDQTPPFITDQKIAATAQAVDSDRHFTEQIEQRLPPGAMIFQLPMMAFPESPVHGVGAYDHFRPYLYARDLRFSFGSVKGRPHDAWQHELAKLSLTEAVQRLESFGFAAIYVNKQAFSDQGLGLVKQLQAAGLTDMIQSDRGDLLCVFLHPSPHPVLPDAPP